MIELYPDQQEFEDVIYEQLRLGHKHILAQAPTGYGKTVLLSDVGAKAAFKSNKTLIVTHREELLDQDDESMFEFGLNIGRITRDIKLPPENMVCVAMIETLMKRLSGRYSKEWIEWYSNIPILVIDEAHDQSFNKLLMLPISRDKFFIGLSATPERRGKQRQLKEDYDVLVRGKDVQELININRLVTDRLFDFDVDLKGVSISNGDYDSSEMFSRYNKTELYAGVIDNWKRICPNTITLMFCCNIQHCINSCRALNEAGIKAKYIVSDVAKPKELDLKATKGDIAKYNIKKLEYENYISTFDALSGKRKEVIKEWKDGEFYFLINAGIATTGFNHKPIQTIVLDRATMSKNLLYQMIGRGSRTFFGKEFFYLLDFGKNCERLGYYRQQQEYSLTHEESKSEGVGVGAVKDCPKCGALVHASSKICKYCGFVFPVTHEQKIVELTEISYSEAVKELKNIKDYEIYSDAKGYNKNWLFRQVFIKFGKEGLIEYAKTHHYPANWVYIQIARYKAQNIRN